MPRELLLVAPMLAAALGACSPAEPPLLIDGGEAPATKIGQAAPSSENRASPAEERPARD